jgi:ribonuclease HII
VFYYERKLEKQGFNFIIGVDEAGRGPLAGPVVAAAVALKSRRLKCRIDDSKKLSPRQREMAFQEITGNSFWGIGIVDNKAIDALNILQATRRAMQQAVCSLVEKANFSPTSAIHVIIDGNVLIDVEFPCLAIVRGDARSKSIASASILAKVTRDRIMLGYDEIFPEYGFKKHKGYPTPEHKRALDKFGPSPIHRQSFSGV